jgi:hypothetical protein
MVTYVSYVNWEKYFDFYSATAQNSKAVRDPEL